MLDVSVIHVCLYGVLEREREREREGNIREREAVLLLLMVAYGTSQNSTIWRQKQNP
jgi:hypothetical protein